MPTSLLDDLQHYADNAVHTHNIPAVSIAVWHNNTLTAAASGLLNINTGVEATTDSVFQVGSITKVFTASLVMKLVEMGKVELDKPVKEYLREFRVADSGASAAITVRHLLTHTAGFDGDYYPDDANEMGNLIARYVDRLNLVPQRCAPGKGFSYSNGAYAVAGRLVEVMTGMSYFEAIEEWIYKPLSMQHAVGHPMNTLRYRAAMGHYPRTEKPDEWELAPVCYASLGLAPCGRLSMSASDVVIFAKAHLNYGKTDNGHSWLSAETLASMQQSQTTLPPHTGQLTDWGLGWSLMNGLSTPMLGHDGLTVGQSAVLRVLPEYNMAFALLTNCAKGCLLTGIADDLLNELADIKPIPIPEPTELTNLERFTGHYDSLGAAYQVALEHGQLVITIHNKVLPVPDTSVYLKPIDKQSFAAFTEAGYFAGNQTFIDYNEEGVPQSLFTGLRLNTRVK